ncbi:Gfo/Idh/MocA family protein [Cytobacillus purgationiresistens]|uniref:Dehydrogenase n=1 Tax=Cytobacillus purgationiresistens TaxID=863449 RepID=A0ABU0AM97_9BACI|nr:Gfo/Idh/MocA family oxidoreductase [Cytobacillus purgationiresistens]MDQ0272357.1 putative dehydrogenase [Cytobacillus purgationiresistens]
MESIKLNYKTGLAKGKHGIAIIGAGAITNAAHLPAYKKAGFNVVGIYDINSPSAHSTAMKFSIPKVYESLDDLLADADVSVVDIAVPPWFQHDIVEKAVKAKKHLLCQKPLSDTFEESVKIVEMAKEHGVKLAANLQMRYEPLIAGAKDLLNRGWIGDPIYGEITVSIKTYWEAWPWLVQSPILDLMYHSIHYFDSFRYLFGLPETIYTTVAKHPAQLEQGESRNISILEYPGNLRLLVTVNHNNELSDPYAKLRIEGTEGVINGTFGLMYDYPHGRPDTLEFYSKKYYPDQWISQKFDETWIPDAFIYTMNELLLSIEEGREPQNSGKDVLGTLQLVHSGYLSSKEKRPVSPSEIISLNEKEPIFHDDNK